MIALLSLTVSIMHYCTNNTTAAWWWMLICVLAQMHALGVSRRQVNILRHRILRSGRRL
jgi:hypothetical protein